MARKRSVGQRIALGCGGLIGLVIILALAGYAILQAVGARQVNGALARIKASGAPTTWEEAIPKPVPDDQNAAFLYEKAFAAMVRPLGSHELEAFYAYIGSRPGQDPRAFEPEAARIVAANTQALRYTAAAAKRPRCRFNRDWRDPERMLLPEPSRLRTLAQLVCARSLLLAYRGDTSGALDTWRINVAILRHQGADSTVLSQLSHYPLLSWASPSLRRILQDGSPAPQQCRSLDQALSGLNLTADLVRCLEVERTVALWRIDRARADQAAFHEMRRGPASLTLLTSSLPQRGPRLQQATQRLRPVFDAAAWSGYRAATAAVDRNALLSFWEEQMRLARRPYRETARALERLKRAIPDGAVVARFYGDLDDRWFRSRDLSLTQIGLMRTALGLAACRAQFGRYPDSLGQLRKRLSWDLPKDPFSGKDFAYRRRGNGYLLYSIGQDFKGDGGAAVTFVRDPRNPRHSGPKGDIVWRMER